MTIALPLAAEDEDNVAVLSAAKAMLSALWARAMDNDASYEEIKAIRLGLVAVAVAEHGLERVGLFADWQLR